MAVNMATGVYRNVAFQPVELQWLPTRLNHRFYPSARPNVNVSDRQISGV